MARANPVRSRQRFEADPQGVGYGQLSGLVQYYDRILGGYEEDVTGDPSTLTGTSHMIGTQAATPQRLRGEIVKDAELVGHAWNGAAYNAFKTSVTTRADGIAAAGDLMKRTGGALETVSQALLDGRPKVQTIRREFAVTAWRMAVTADLRAAEAPNPAAGNVIRWQAFQEINKLGLGAVKNADAIAKQVDVEIGKASTELRKVEGEAGGDTYNPLTPRTPQTGSTDPVARLIYRNGFEDQGPEVRQLQTMLAAETGADGKPLLGGVSGVWDAETQRAVDGYLTRQQLPPFDAALADPSRLPPRFQALWPVMQQAARDYRIDPVYLMAVFDREHSGAPRGRALADGLVGQGAINRGEIGGGHGHGVPQIDVGYHSTFLEGNAYGYDPQTSVPYAFSLIRQNLDDRRANGDIHKAFNLYNGGMVKEPPISGANYGLDTTSRARVFRRMLYGLDRTEPTAAAPQPEPATRAGKTTGYTADPDVLSRLRKDLLDNSYQAAEVVAWLRNTRVPVAAFGSRKSSEQASDAFHRASAAVASKLRLDAKGVADIAESVLDAANGYQGGDVLLRNEILGLKPRSGMPGR